MSTKKRSEIEQLEAMKAKMEETPDEVDGVDLRQYKRQAIMTLDTAVNQMTVVFKLSS